MEVPHLNLFVEENPPLESLHQILSAVRPDWDLSATKIKTFTRGITNQLFGCFNSLRGEDVVLIRVYGKKTDLLVDRRKETENLKVLHSAGLAPALYGTFGNGLVYQYVPGEVLTPSTCRWENVSGLVARRLADLHSFKPEDSFCPELVPALWKFVDRFLSLVPEKFSDGEKERRFVGLFLEKPDLRKELSFLKRTLLPLNDSVVFCHNDLLLGNIIHNPETNSVAFIDYEYADFNYRSYDVANHFNEFAGVESVDYSLFPEESFQRKWIRIYLERIRENSGGCEDVEIAEEELDSFYLRIQKFTLASHFVWAVWSLLQAEHSSIQFDFVNYAFVRFQEYYKRKNELFSV